MEKFVRNRIDNAFIELLFGNGTGNNKKLYDRKDMREGEVSDVNI